MHFRESSLDSRKREAVHSEFKVIYVAFSFDREFFIRTGLIIMITFCGFLKMVPYNIGVMDHLIRHDTVTCQGQNHILLVSLDANG